MEALAGASSAVVLVVSVSGSLSLVGRGGLNETALAADGLAWSAGPPGLPPFGDAAAAQCAAPEGASPMLGAREVIACAGASPSFVTLPPGRPTRRALLSSQGIQLLPPVEDTPGRSPAAGSCRGAGGEAGVTPESPPPEIGKDPNPSSIMTAERWRPRAETSNGGEFTAPAPPRRPRLTTEGPPAAPRCALSNIVLSKYLGGLGPWGTAPGRSTGWAPWAWIPWRSDIELRGGSGRGAARAPGASGRERGERL